MECFDVLRARRSVRKYKKGAPVPAEHVRLMLEAAMYAPSAVNSRPWEFFVTDKDSVKERLMQAHPACKMLRFAIAPPAPYFIGVGALIRSEKYFYDSRARPFASTWKGRRKAHCGRIPDNLPTPVGQTARERYFSPKISERLTDTNALSPRCCGGINARSVR